MFIRFQAEHLCFFDRLSTMDKYYIPKDGNLSTYKEYISMLPNIDNPEAFGQHPNADIASQITEARNLFETLLSLQPKIATKTGVSQEEKVLFALRLHVDVAYPTISLNDCLTPEC